MAGGMHFLRLPLLAIAIAPLMAACAGGGMDGEELQIASQTTKVPVTEAFVMPAPGGPAVVAVIQERHTNGRFQKIVLSTNAHTPGQNKFEVSVFGPVRATTSPDAVLINSSLSRPQIALKLREEFPSVAMGISSNFLQNKYGPFGYAIGRSAAGDNCFYGWQRIGQMDGDADLMTPRGAIEVRLRLCDGIASEAQLLRVMYDFTINAYFSERSWNPYGSPPKVDESLGRSGSPTYPMMTPAMLPSPETRVIAAPRVVRERQEPRVSGPDPRNFSDYPEIPPAGSMRAQ